MAMKVAVIGSTGQLGNDLVEVLKAHNYVVFPLTHADVECTDPASVKAALEAVRPEVVVNCASFVRVDNCEDLLNDAFQVNALGAGYVARSCAAINAQCVHISTDYVFDGEKGGPYIEEDAPCPINVYGISKLAGEQLVRESVPQWLIVRVSSLFGKVGARGKGGNFVETILARAKAGDPLRVVDDIRMSPTYTYDSALGLEYLIQQGVTGVVHLSNSGACSWYEFACEALRLSDLDAQVEPISSQDYPSKASRPRDSSLKSQVLGTSARGCLRPWPQALEAYLVEKGHRIVSP